MSISTIDQFVADLLRAPGQMVHRGRGVTALYGVDAAVDKVDGLGPDDNLRGRMSRDQSKVEGYMFAEGWDAFRKEHGTSTSAPTSPMSRAAESVLDDWADRMGELAEDVLS